MRPDPHPDARGAERYKSDQNWTGAIRVSSKGAKRTPRNATPHYAPKLMRAGISLMRRRTSRGLLSRLAWEVMLLRRERGERQLSLGSQSVRQAGCLFPKARSRATLVTSQVDLSCSSPESSSKSARIRIGELVALLLHAVSHSSQYASRSDELVRFRS